MTATIASGLEGVVVAATAKSEVDGERGLLIIAGHDVERLAASATFEQAAFLLSRGRLPDGDEHRAFRAALGQARARVFEGLPGLGDALSANDGMDALRAGLGHLQATADAQGDELMALAAPAVFVSAWARKRQGKAPVAPDAASGHAADYLRMTTGEAPTSARAQALEAYLVTVCDHGMNASTFAARVVASTGSCLVSSIVAAVGALKGPLHGGAPGPVLDMLDAIGEPSRAEAFLEGELLAGRRIMGMGHRIYRVRDPRAAVLEAATLRLEQAGVATPRLAMARAVERAAEGVLGARYPKRSLKANVEFYTAVLLDAIGLAREQFAPTFAVGRVAGWVAHVAEQRAEKKLIRPASVYVGPWPDGVPRQG